MQSRFRRNGSRATAASFALGLALCCTAVFAQNKTDSTVRTSTLVTPLHAPEGVRLEASVQPGLTAKDNLALKINLIAPRAKHVCIAYSGFETIGFIRRPGAPRIPQLDASEHKCSDQTDEADQPFNDSVLMQRRDAPESNALLRPNWDNLSQAEQRRRTDFRDGYVIVVATLDGEPAIFKVNSSYFALDAMVLKNSGIFKD